MRRVIAALVVVGLAIGVFLLWPREDDDPPDTEAAGTTTPTSITASSTTTTPGTTSTSSEETQVVETVEEAEQILRELWFGWFEGIYNEDEERIREVVASQAMLNAAKDAFGQLPFTAAPSEGAMDFLELDILMSTERCLAVWSVTQPAFLEVPEPRSGVEVLRRVDGSWRFLSAWQLREDLWQPDCESQLVPLS